MPAEPNQLVRARGLFISHGCEISAVLSARVNLGRFVWRPGHEPACGRARATFRPGTDARTDIRARPPRLVVSTTVRPLIAGGSVPLRPNLVPGLHLSGARRESFGCRAEQRARRRYVAPVSARGAGELSVATRRSSCDECRSRYRRRLGVGHPREGSRRECPIEDVRAPPDGSHKARLGVPGTSVDSSSGAGVALLSISTVASFA